MRVQQMMGRCRRSERGAVALMVAILSLVLFACAAFVTDFGIAYTKQRSLQNGVDAAALAAARNIAASASKSATCSDLATAYPDSTVKSLAQPTFDLNIASATITTSTVSCQAIPGYAKTQLVVTITGHKDTPSVFGQVFRPGGLEVNRTARVIMGNALPYNLRPFGVCSHDADALETQVAGTYAAHTLVFTSPSDAQDASVGGCGSAVGNSGLLDLSGGSGRGAGPSGCDGVKGWILCGFNGTLSDPANIAGQSGGFGAGDLSSQMSTLNNKDIALPVYNNVSGNGSATYKVTGFIVVHVCGWNFQVKPSDEIAAGFPNDTNHRFNCYDDTELKNSATLAKAKLGDQKIDFMQLLYVKSITVGELDGGCALGDATCDYGTRTAILAD